VAERQPIRARAAHAGAWRSRRRSLRLSALVFLASACPSCWRGRAWARPAGKSNRRCRKNPAPGPVPSARAWPPRAKRGAGNNRAVSTATASSFLNVGTRAVVSVAGTGCRYSPAAGRSRRAGTVRPARRPRPAPVAGRGGGQIPCGRRRPGTPGPARASRRRRSARRSGSTDAGRKLSELARHEFQA